MSTPTHVILLDRATADERAAVHEIVKANARGWWHHHTDSWIVRGTHSSTDWRDLLRPAIGPGASSVLVLQLPTEPKDRRWAFYGSQAKRKAAWLHESFKRP